MINKIYTYSRFSRSAKLLRDELGIGFINNSYEPREYHRVLNWGCSVVPDWDKEVRWINHPLSVATAVDKVKTFIKLRDAGVRVPDFTTDKAEMREWLRSSEKPLIGRSLRRGTQGRGIHYLAPESFSEASVDEFRLMTRYIPKTAEYRVHIFNGEIIDLQQKKRDLSVETENVNYQVRNHSNGWVFCREGVEEPHDVRIQVYDAMFALSLDFGAVDVVWNRHKGAFVLEVNTAPGLVGSTAYTYIKNFCAW